SFGGANIGGVDLTGVTADATAFVNLGETPWAYATVTASYKYDENTTIDIELSAYYELVDGKNNVYLTLNKIGTLEPAFAVYCEVSEIAEAVKQLLTYFNVGEIAMPETSIDTASVISGILSADFETLIGELTANSAGLTVTVDLDNVLAILGTELDIELGEATLNYSTENKNFAVSAANFGLGLTASVSEQTKPAYPADCLNLTELVNLVNDALANRTFEIGVSFGGANIGGVDLTGVTADATAFVNLGETPWAYATVTASYKYDENTTIDIELSAYYELVDGKNNVYLTLNKIGTLEPAFAVYCEVSEIAEAVKQLLTYFNVGEIAMPETSIDTASVISGILSADFETLIGELTANSNGLTVTVDLDNVLAILGTELDIELGEATLNYNTADKNFAVSAANFGLGLTASVSEQTKPAYPADCLDLTELVNLVNDALANRTFEIGLSFGGANIGGVDLTGVTADATAFVNLGETPWAYATVTASYKYDENTTIDIELSAYYELVDGKNNVYLTLNKIGTLEPAFAVYCEVSEIAEAVKQLLTYFNVGEIAMPETSIDTASVISGILSADFETLIGELTANSNGLTVTVDLDNVLAILGTELDIELGKATLNYNTADKNFAVNAANFGLGLTASVSEQTKPAYPADCLDLTELVNFVNDALANRTFEIGVSFGGANIGGVDLTGVTADVAAFVNLGETPWAYATVEASYAYDENTVIDLELSAYYEYVDGKNNVYLTLTRINGVMTDIAVRCEVSELTTAVEQLIALVNGAEVQTASEENVTSEGAVNAATVIAALLSVDFDTLVTELTANSDGLKICVNLDNVLALFVEEFGVSLGTATLEYVPATAEGGPAVISGGLPELNIGLNASLSEQEKPAMPVNSLDLSALINTVNAAYGQIKNIIDEQSAYFEIDSGDVAISVDGLTAGVYGSGEIVWKPGCESVALDLSVYISENGAADVADIKLVYDKNATDKPVVILALNNVAIAIYSEDIDGFKRDFDNLFNTICTAFGITSSGSQVQTASANYSSLSENDKLFASLFGVLAGSDWVEFLNNFTLVSDGRSAALSGLISTVNDKYNTALSVSVDGAFTLAYSVEDYDNASAFATGGRITVSSSRTADDGFESLAQALRAKISQECIVSSTADPETPSFSQIVFGYIFDAFNSLSFDNILGTNTYGVEFLLDGNSSNIPALGGVYVNANLYFTGKSRDTLDLNDSASLTEADLDIDVNGLAIKINVVLDRVGGTTYMYINLNRVADIHLPDLKVVATENDIYNVFEEILSVLTQTNALDFVANLLNTEDSQALTLETDLSGAEVSGETTSALADIISKVLKLNFSDKLLYSVTTGSESGQKITTVHFDIDELLKQLEIDCDYEVGSVEAVINRENHSMVTNVKAMVKQPDETYKRMTWLSLSSTRENLRDYSKFDKTEYIEVSFLSTLISDLVNTLTNDNGEVYEKFSFSGVVTAKIDVKIYKINLTIDVTTLTVGFDENGSFYFSLLGHLHKVSGLVTIAENTIGITYQDGYLTLARNLAASPEYRIMTMEYFIDHIFDSSQTSPVQWLLKCNMWSTIAPIIKSSVPLSSGLEDTKDIYMYSASSETTEQEISIYDYINALEIVLGNGKDVVINEGNVQGMRDSLSITEGENYYAFALNAPLATAGVLDELSAAIMRNDEQGVNGLRAYGSLEDGMVSFTVRLDNYLEGVVSEYEPGVGAAVYTAVEPDEMFYVLEGEAEEGVTYYIKDANGAYVVATEENWTEGTTVYVLNADIYYIATSNGYVIAEGYDSANTYYSLSYSEALDNVAAPSFYNKALAMAEADGDTPIDFDHFVSRESDDELFGCYNIGGDMDKYAYSYARYSYILTVLDYDGATVVETVSVRAGSGVYLYDNASPVYTDSTKAYRLLYSDTNGNLLSSSFVMNGETTVVKTRVQAADINVYNNGQYICTVTSFVGDTIPDTVNSYNRVSDGVYADAAMQNKFAEDARVEGNCNVYGMFARAQVAINGVTYTFDSETCTYAASGRAAGFVDKYCTKGETLILENGIDGFPVTSISANAFANTDGKCIKSVIIPSNIVSVGENAFLDNYGMLKVVFLADRVTFKGTQSGKTLPFYGCSTESGGESTSLEVYYTEIVTESGDKWNHFRTSVAFFTFQFWIGENGNYTNNSKYCGGAKISSGWYYYDYEIIGAGILGDATFNGLTFEQAAGDMLTTGISTTQTDVDYVQSYLSDLLNCYTAENEDCIDKYTVSVELSVNAFGTSVITVSVTEGEAMYALSASSQIGGTVTISGNTKTFGGKTYANGSVTVTVSDYNEACNLVGWKNVDTDSDLPYDSDGSITLAITGAINLSARFDAELKAVSVVSQVWFTYGGEAPVDNGGNTYSVSVAVKDGVPLVADMKADGYVFLGWATDNGISLEFSAMTADESATYYAIWADNSKSNIVSATQTVAGTLPEGETLTVTEGTFYGWYTDASFATGVSAISAQNTVLFARMKYTVSVLISGSNSNIYIDGSSVARTSGAIAYTYSVDVLEGETFSITNLATQATTISVTPIDDQPVRSAVVTGNKYLSSTKRVFYIDADGDGLKTLTDTTNPKDSVTVIATGNLSYTLLF
ncbi:MAG: InlB B-repeat-containing protein, partial [Candidatus Coproplasma sp.]